MMKALLDSYFDESIHISELPTYYASTSPAVTSMVAPNVNAVLNPNANIFESKESGADAPPEWESVDVETEDSTSEGYVYMNGDVGKLPSGAVYPTTPETLTTSASTTTINEYRSMNGGAESLEPFSQASPPPGGLPGSSSPGPIAGIPLDQLKQLLSSQLEYYFSRENLANDAYLLSQMDNDQYVPIWTVANFNQVKKLTKDIKLITDVLRESPNVQVDEEGIKVRPNHKRCIVILREIPDNTPLEEVKALFSGENCPKVISCEFAHNNSWYVTFESDEDAQRAYRFLREEVREFQGKPIMARIKAKPMNRLPMAPPVPPLGIGANTVAGTVPTVVANPNPGPGVAMKNGYRTPPAAMYEQNAYANQQTRFLYTNGASVPPTVNYGNQVQIYTFPQQPFYPPNMLQPWGPANPTYFDIGSVFSVNGLAPQGSFAKPPSARFNMPRRNRKPQPGSSIGDTGNNMSRPGIPQSYHRVSSPGASSVPPAPKSLTGIHTLVTKPESAAGSANDNHHNHSKSHHSLQSSSHVDSSDASSQAAGSNTLRSDSDDNSYRQARDAQTGKELMLPRHRRRRKEDEVPVTGRTGPTVERKSMAAGDAPQVIHASISAARGPQFDLETTAFPPLPGFEGGSSTSVKTATPLEVPPVESSNSQWENRLSDVVRGTAKPKTTYSTKDKDSSGPGYRSPRASSPASPTPRKTAASPLSVEVKAQPQPPASQSSPLPSTPPAAKLPLTDVATNSVPVLCSVALTPPASPDKRVPPSRNVAEKSTKTDESIPNGDGAAVSSTISRRTPEVSASGISKPSAAAPSKSVPTTTNAATMTSAVVVTDVTSAPARAVASTSSSVATTTSVVTSGLAEPSTQMDGCPARLSYAQVAQHHKEKAERMLRERQNSETNYEKEKEKDNKKETTSRVMHQHMDRDVGQRGERDHRDGRFSGGRGRPFDRPEGQGGFRRRDGPATPRFREFIRPRSPK